MKKTIRAIYHESRKKIIQQARKIILHIDLYASSKVDIEKCESVCLVMGPYRNLTTLTAATLFLHPDCQVLNHAGKRIFGNDEIDFISDFSVKKFNRFIQYATYISSSGKGGNYGGSIMLSHAFKPKYGMNDAFLKTKSSGTKNVKCLFWKESLRTSNLIRQKNVDLGEIFKQDKRLRFILPIRNPMSCAISNIKTGKVHLFEGLTKESSEKEVLVAILKEIEFFMELKALYPDRFFYFFEYEISRDLLVRLANFLQLSPVDAWLDSASAAMKVEDHYTHSEDTVAFYQKQVNEKFQRFPEILKGLLAFL